MYNDFWLNFGYKAQKNLMTPGNSMAKYQMIIVSFSIAMLAACTSVLPVSDEQRCEILMQEAWDELKAVRLTGLGSAWQAVKASKFLAQAKVKYETGRYELCRDKAEEAKRLLQQLEQ